MAEMITFAYYLADKDHPVRSDLPIWNASLPSGRNMSQPPGGPTYGDYFSAGRAFLEKDRCRMLSGAVEELLQRPAGPKDFHSIDIFLDKHGEYYHPSQVVLALADRVCRFVLNVAVDTPGTDLVLREHDLLEMLFRRFQKPYLPRVFGAGIVPFPGGKNAGMFLGEWFEGFYEFHVTKIEPNQQIALWVPDKGPSILSDLQRRSIYRNAAYILTSFYDIETFAQISPWHHAAGDFIFRPGDPGPALRLVTVRGYSPVLREKSDDLVEMLQALLVFCVHVSVRTRLDRLDGTGDVVWADEVALTETVTGLFQGLKETPTPEVFPGPVADVFYAYAGSLSRADLMDLAEAILGAYPEAAEETDVIRCHLSDHVHQLHSAIQNQ